VLELTQYTLLMTLDLMGETMTFLSGKRLGSLLVPLRKP
jgi:hypothetical protein